MAREPRPRRLKSGTACLEDWAAHAGQAAKNVVYEALFAVADGTVRHRYKVLDDVSRNGQFFVLLRIDLVMKISVDPLNTFSVIYIGDLTDAPDVGTDAA